MSDTFEYDVFLSFASADEELVKPIWQEMSLSGLRIFWSDETLKQNIGQPFIEVIQNALIRSKHFVLICTKNSMQSEWVKDEYQTFYGQCHIPSKRKRRLILLKIKDFNISSLPPFLRSIQLSDSVEQTISILGGVNIQALKQENNLLKQRVEIALKEKANLEKQLKLEGILKRKLIFAWIVILIILVSIVTYAIVSWLIFDKAKEKLKEELKAKKEQIVRITEERRYADKALKRYIHDLKEENEKLKIKCSKPHKNKPLLKSVKTIPPIQLRPKPIENLSIDEVKKMLKERDFFASNWNKQGKGMTHQYKTVKEEGEELVIDHNTGLTWQWSGSSTPMVYANALRLKENLNKKRFAGYSDWRLPTLEEAMSLIETEKNNYGLYISEVFDQTQGWIWTSDKKSSSVVWVVNFYVGNCSNIHEGYSNPFVRAVR